MNRLALYICSAVLVSGCIDTSEHQRAQTIIKPHIYKPGAPSTQEPQKPGLGQISGALKGWKEAPAPIQWAAPEESFVELGFPQSLPTKPSPLDAATWMPWTSGRAIATHNDHLYLVDTENDSLRIVSRLTGKTTKDIYVGSRPEQVVVSPNGDAFVSVRHDSSVVRIPSTGSVLHRQVVGTEPHGIALSTDGSILYVAVTGSNTVRVLDADSLAELTYISGLTRPRNVMVSPTGFLLITQQGTSVITKGLDSEGFPTTKTYSRSLRVDLPSDGTLHPGRPDQVHSNRAFAATFSPANPANALVVHRQTITGAKDHMLTAAMTIVTQNELLKDIAPLPPTTGEKEVGYGGHMTSKVPHVLRPITVGVTTVKSPQSTSDQQPSVADVTKATGSVKDAKTLEPMESLIAQPTDINHHPTWSLAFVTGMGTDNVLVLNTKQSDPMRSPLAIIDVGMAPKAITFSEDGTKAYVLNSHAFTVSQIDLSPLFAMADSKGVALGEGEMDRLVASDTTLGDVTDPIRISHSEVFAFGVDPLPSELHAGRRIYHFARNKDLSHGGKFACNSCHFEGGQDGLAWASPSGILQTPLLAGRLLNTAPFNWLGTEDNLKDNMSQTIKRMGGEGLSEDDLVSLEKYLTQGLVPSPNPHIQDKLTEAQMRGEALFNDPVVGCATCHSGAEYTDGKRHNVGAITPEEQELMDMLSELTFDLDPSGIDIAGILTQFNTPSLRDLHLSAPYFHNGSASTLMEMLDQTATTMGRTDHLTLSQKEDLVAFLLTL